MVRWLTSRQTGRSPLVACVLDLNRTARVCAFSRWVVGAQLPHLLTDTAVLEQLVDMHLPAVADQLRRLEFDWLLVTPDWFVSLFFDSAPPNISAQIWDVIFWSSVDGARSTVLWVALCLVSRVADELSVSTSFQEVVSLLRESATALPPDAGLEASLQSHSAPSLDTVHTQAQGLRLIQETRRSGAMTTSGSSGSRDRTDASAATTQKNRGLVERFFGQGSSSGSMRGSSSGL